MMYMRDGGSARRPSYGLKGQESIGQALAWETRFIAPALKGQQSYRPSRGVIFCRPFRTDSLEK